MIIYKYIFNIFICNNTNILFIMGQNRMAGHNKKLSRTHHKKRAETSKITFLEWAINPHGTNSSSSCGRRRRQRRTKNKHEREGEEGSPGLLLFDRPISFISSSAGWSLNTVPGLISPEPVSPLDVPAGPRAETRVCIWDSGRSLTKIKASVPWQEDLSLIPV